MKSTLLRSPFGGRRCWTSSRCLAVITGLLLIPAVQAFSQTLEERDHDEPDVEQAVDVPEETTADISAAERMIVEQTNQFRSQEQLAAVKPNDHLKETARYFADFMFQMLDTTLEVEDGAEYVVRESAGKLKVANRTNGSEP